MLRLLYVQRHYVASPSWPCASVSSATLRLQRVRPCPGMPAPERTTSRSRRRTPRRATGHGCTSVGPDGRGSPSGCAPCGEERSGREDPTRDHAEVRSNRWTNPAEPPTCTRRHAMHAPRRREVPDHQEPLDQREQEELAAPIQRTGSSQTGLSAAVDGEGLSDAAGPTPSVRNSRRCCRRSCTSGTTRCARASCAGTSGTGRPSSPAGSRCPAPTASACAPRSGSSPSRCA